MSRLEDLAKNVGALGNTGSRARRRVAETRAAVGTIMNQVPRQGGSEVLAALQAAQRELTRADGDLATFGQQATHFANRLVSSGGSEEPSGNDAAPAAGTSKDSARDLGVAELSDVGLANVDYGDNPIIDNFGKGGATRGDYEWAVRTWHDVISPGVARGLTRGDFEAMDNASGAPAFRRVAAAYDLFLGDSDRLKFTRRPDGKLEVINGRHRIEVARALGIGALPGKIIER